jgi:hypothetical protein
MQEWKEYESQAPSDRTEVTAWEVEKYLYA